MKRSTWLAILNGLIVLSVIAAFAVTFLIGLTAFGVASSLSVGEPSFNSSGSVVTFSIPVTASNPGPFSVSGIALSLKLKDPSGVQVLSASSPVVNLPPASQGARIDVPVTINLSDLPQEALARLYQASGNLTLDVAAQASIAPFLTIHAGVSAAVPWSLPSPELQLGEPEPLGYNSTHLTASIPVYLSNNEGLIPINGSVGIRVVDAESGRVVGSGTLPVYAPPGSEFSGDLAFSLALPENKTALLFEDSTFHYNLTIWFEAFGSVIRSESQPVEFAWGAPMGDSYLGTPSVVPYNSTHSRVEFPVGFRNNNDFITIDGWVRMRIVVNGSAVAESQPVVVHALPHAQFSSQIVLYVPDWALPLPGTLVIDVSTPLGDSSLEVPYNG